jgi:DNA gyrase/topoisomerase IV subunit B
VVRTVLNTTDHGYHIAALLVGNLYALNPDIITSGYVSVVVPPLYSLEFTGRKQRPPNIYFRNEDALQCWMAEHVYMNALDIGVRFKGHTDKTYRFKTDDGIKFIRLVMAIGKAIDNIAEELVLSPTVVERLTHATNYLDPRHGPLDVGRIRDILQADRVAYEPNGQILIMTIGRDDHIIPLQNVRDRLIQVVLPVMNRIQWRTTQTYITTKHTSDVRDSPISLTELCGVLQKLDGQFHIERYKGLGGMKPEDTGRTCTDPAHRNTFRITSVGDVDCIFKLLGKNNSAHRKRLIQRP